MNTKQEDRIRFTQDDLIQFAKTSGDWNPMHMDELYARKSAYGRQIVFGMLGVLKALRFVPVQKINKISNIKIDFINAMLLDKDYHVHLDSDTDTSCCIKITDQTSGYVDICFGFCEIKDPAIDWNTYSTDGNRKEAANITDNELEAKLQIEKKYKIDNKALQEYLSHNQLENSALLNHIHIFCMCSYIIGMEIPGKSAMFTGMKLDISSNYYSESHELYYCANVNEYDKNFRMLTLGLKVGCAGKQIALGELKCFVKQELESTILYDELRIGDYSGPSDEKPVALVMGGSRGLGAALVQCLAGRGYRVILNFLKSKKEAEYIQSSINQVIKGAIILYQGNITQKAQCDSLAEFIEKTTGRLDILVCNAALPPMSEKNKDLYEQMNEKYYQYPISSCLELLKKWKGIVVAISSIYADKGPKELSHYVNAKRKMEEYIFELSKKNKECRFLVVRPKPLRTDMNNTPSGLINTMKPEIAAAVIAEEIANNKNYHGENYQLISDFNQKVSVKVAATFTIDHFTDSLVKYGEFIGLSMKINKTGYNQVLQELLNPNGAFYESGYNIVLIRLCDWRRYKRSTDVNGFVSGKDVYDDTVPAFYENSMDDYINAFQYYSDHSLNSMVVMMCPESQEYLQDVNWLQLFDKMVPMFIERLMKIKGIRVIHTQDFHEDYKVNNIFDPAREVIGHIPFAPSYFNYMSSLAVRHYFFMMRKKPKVIIVDCDYTLWKGIVGEAGACGIEITNAYQVWQRKLLDLVGHGWLLCLCSKNNENDVTEVFKTNKDMILSLDHIVASYINWNQKSENIKMLSSSLKLGMDSFVFIDDSEMECEEVRNACPDVLSLCFPKEEDRIEHFVKHLWILDDYDSVTVEDAVRTDFYKANAERDSLEQNSESFEKFIQSLNVQIQFNIASEGQLSRVSQMTMRTNQFNFTTIRRNEQQLMSIISDSTYSCITVNVTDKFGDYGQVGLMIGKQDGYEFIVDTFLLSCRVLGRKIENTMMEYIAITAKSRKCSRIRVKFVKSEKNFPAYHFFQTLAEVPSAKLTQLSKEEYECKCSVKKLLKSKLKEAKNSSHSSSEVIKINNHHQTSNLRETEKLLERIYTKAFCQEVIDGILMHDTPRNERTSHISMENYDHNKVILTRKDIEKSICSSVSKCTNITKSTISFTQPIENFPWESMKKVEISSELVKKYPKLSLTFLYEFPTLGRVADFLEQEYATEKEMNQTIQSKRIVSTGNANQSPETSDDIAVIGFSAYLPGADNVSEFWNNLTQGKCSITEIPENRWDSKFYYDSNYVEPGKTYCNYGGFLNDIESFDYRFFGISAKEAMAMDPQQRLFLQIVWNAIENAGYRADVFDKNTGVFVGAISNDFSHYLNSAAELGYSPYRWGDFYQIANRISYFFDWKGPSMVVDTACSSSGTAFYLACRSIANRDCNIAVVGGVNLILHPSRYIQYSHMGLLTKQDRCYPFSENAQGTIMGEGIGALIIKNKSAAIQDGDYIYGIVKGCSINSGGKTNGFTVPNPVAQTELIQNALRNAGIEPEKISYVEAHGTGTKVGDPIEISGIKNALGTKTSATHIGTVKSNIGHLESTATIAGMIKVLLQMKYRTLVPSINAYPLNSMLELKDNSIIIQKEIKNWGEEDENLYAGISSFGAGGSNFHAIIESYPQKNNEFLPADSYIILLSSKAKQQLFDMVQQLYTYLKSEDKYNIIKDEKEYLTRLSYTLQVGRNPFEHRVAFTVSDLQELFMVLENLVENRAECNMAQMSDLSNGNLMKYQLDEQEVEYYKYLFVSGKHSKLMHFWLLGVDVPWSAFYEKYHITKLPLPGYVFEKKYLPLSSIKNCGKKRAFYEKLNSPIIAEKCFQLDIGLKEFPFLYDHQVNNTLIVPGAFPLSLMLTVIMRELHYSVLKLSDITFRKALILENNSSSYPAQVVIDSEKSSISVYVDKSKKDEERQWYLYTKGMLERNETYQKYRDVNHLILECHTHIDNTAFYKYGAEQGFQWGKQFQCIKEIWLGEKSVTAKLSFLYEEKEDSVFPASVLDACLQTYLYAMEQHCQLINRKATYIPFSIEELILYSEVPEEFYTYTEFRKPLKVQQEYFQIDVTVLNLSGKIVCKVHGLRLKEVENHILDGAEQALKNYMYQSQWLLEEKNYAACRIHNDARTVFWMDDNPKLRALISEVEEDSEIQMEEFDFNKLLDENKESYQSLRENLLLCFNKIRNFAKLYHDQETEFILFTVNYDDLHVMEPFYQAITGMVKVMNSEDSNITVKVIEINNRDLDVCTEDRDYKKYLIDCISICLNSEDTVGFSEYRIANFQTLRRVLVPMVQMGMEEASGLITADDTCLILGGAGGIGYELSKYLVSNKKCNLVWMGRSTEEACMRQLESIRNMGGKIIYIQADATDIESLSEGMSQLPDDINITGVIHCAIILKDSLLSNMSEEDFVQVFDTKVLAMKNLLHKLNMEYCKFVINFSSECVFRGSPAQANYVAACRYLDAYLMKECKQRDMILKNINWGFWGESGIVSKGDYAKRLKSIGLFSFSNEEGIRIFDRILASEDQEIIAIKINDQYERKVCINRYVELRREAFDTELVDQSIHEADLQFMNHYDYSEIKRYYNEFPQMIDYAKLIAFFIQKEVLELDETQVVKKFPKYIKALKEIQHNPAADVSSFDDISFRNGLNHGIRAWYEFVDIVRNRGKEILEGAIKFSDAFFEKGSNDIVEGIYRYNPVSTYYNNKMAVLIRSIVHSMTTIDKKKIRILEFGAGTGSTSEIVLNALKPYEKQIEYVFTDVSMHFLQIARNKFQEEYDFVQYRLFDFTKPIEEQSIEQGSFDIILGTNAIHICSSISKVLTNLGQALAPNGYLCINELTSSHEALTVAFGLFTGWWDYEDEKLRIKNSPLLKKEQWIDLLKNTGYRNVQAFDCPIVHSKSWSVQHVFLAKNPGTYKKVLKLTNKSNASVRKTVENTTQKVSKIDNSQNWADVTAKEKKNKLYEMLCKDLKDIMMMEESETISLTSGFKDMGIDSLLAIQFRDRLEERTSLKLSSTIIYDYPNINTLVEYLSQRMNEEKSECNDSRKGIDESVVKMDEASATQENITDMYRDLRYDTIYDLKDRIDLMTEDETAEMLMRELNITL